MGITFAQRGSYAGTLPKGYPELASRFKDTNDGSSSTFVPLADRINNGDAVSTTETVEFEDTINKRINEWPREHRPFSILNADHIQAHLHPQESQQPSGSSGNVQFQSRFNDYDNFDNTRPIRIDNQRPSFLGTLRP